MQDRTPTHRSKREELSRLCASTGLTRLLEWLPQRPVLIVLNYHRIGDGRDSPFDSGVYSATEEEFDAQVSYLKKRFQIVPLEEALSITRGQSGAGASVLITFDDGYEDNYRLAFPILRSHGVPALFFLPTAFIGTAKLPWWDRIAWVVKHSQTAIIRLGYPEPAEFHLDRPGPREAIERILRLYKLQSMTDPDRFHRELEQACQASPPSRAGRSSFLTWENAREMLAAGMAFGSHTHSHPILTSLDVFEQVREMRTSREILERELKSPIQVLAYPVGGRDAFSTSTVEALKQTGYHGAFSFYGGLNRPGTTSPFDIRRVPVAGQSGSRFRLQTSMGAITASRWF